MRGLRFWAGAALVAAGAAYSLVGALAGVAVAVVGALPGVVLAEVGARLVGCDDAR